MELQVEVEAINPTSGQRRKVASSYLVYVKLGPNGRPAEVPPWVPQTDTQKLRAEHADRRRAIRNQEETREGILGNIIPDQDTLLSRFRAFARKLIRR
jgi:acyl-CoA hydrolase